MLGFVKRILRIPTRVRVRHEIWRIIDSDWVSHDVAYLTRSEDGFYTNRESRMMRHEKVPPKILEKVSSGVAFVIEEFENIVI